MKLNLKKQKNNKLTLKQKRFTDEYLSNGGNGQKAALITYDTQDPNTARSIASENLIKPNVQEYIQRKNRKYEITVELVLERLRQAIDSEDPVIMLKACELSGKYLRMFSADKELENLRSLEHVKLIGWSNACAHGNKCPQCGYNLDNKRSKNN